MARRNSIPAKNIALRIRPETLDELTRRAQSRGQKLGTYLRELLEAFAPGTARRDVKELADELRAVEFVTDK